MGGGKKYLLLVVFGLAVSLSVVYFFLMPKVSGSPFHSSFHFVCHFSIMVMGGMVYRMKDRLRIDCMWKDACLMALSFIAYFLLLAVGKGKVDARYYVQILALIPLHTFVYYTYKFVSYRWAASSFELRGVGRCLSVVANLTLEIYVVQFMLITNKFNSLFPLNIFIVFVLICIAAYFLKVMTSLFLSVMSKEHLEWKEILAI